MSGEAVALAHPPVEVNAAEFRDAVSRLPAMKRGPIGVQGKIPRDTILAPDADGIVVETPVMSSLVHASKAWRMRISVDATRLLEVCERFKKIGAFSSKDDRFLISVDSYQLKVRFQSTAISIPIL